MRRRKAMRPRRGDVRVSNMGRLRAEARSLRSAVPADRLLVEVDVDLLDLEILVEAPGAELAAVAGLLEAAPGRLDRRRLHVVDPDDAGAQPAHGAHRLEEIARPDGRGEAVVGVVGDAVRFLLVVERDDRHHRTEYLLARDGGGVVDVVED